MTVRRVSLALPLVVASAQVPGPLTDDLLAQQGAAVREAVAGQLVPVREGDTQKLQLHKTKKALPDARVWKCRSHSLSGSVPAY